MLLATEMTDMASLDRHELLEKAKLYSILRINPAKSFEFAANLCSAMARTFDLCPSYQRFVTVVKSPKDGASAMTRAVATRNRNANQTMFFME